MYDIVIWSCVLCSVLTTKSIVAPVAMYLTRFTHFALPTPLLFVGDILLSVSVSALFVLLVHFLLFCFIFHIRMESYVLSFSFYIHYYYYILFISERKVEREIERERYQ